MRRRGHGKIYRGSGRAGRAHRPLTPPAASYCSADGRRRRPHAAGGFATPGGCWAHQGPSFFTGRRCRPCRKGPLQEALLVSFARDAGAAQIPRVAATLRNLRQADADPLEPHVDAHIANVASAAARASRARGEPNIDTDRCWERPRNNGPGDASCIHSAEHSAHGPFANAFAMFARGRLAGRVRATRVHVSVAAASAPWSAAECPTHFARSNKG